MFGYIAINKAEMKFRDFDIYQAYYCGLCKVLKEKYGKAGQITLSYDMTFLIVLLSGLYEPDAAESHVSCIAHPFQKHTARVNDFTSYAADMNLILSYYKCLDDWQDERKKKAYISAHFLQAKVRELQKLYPEKVSLIADRLQLISAYEKQNEQNLDRMAGLFGEIMSEIFAYRQDEWETSLRKFGFFLGKFIYLMDAFEDIDDDLANECYNPLKEAYKREDFNDYCKQILTMMIAECSREFEKLPILTHAEILRNILYSGVWCRYEAVCEKRRKALEGEQK
ncbi:MAG: DUF5685 family protein [Eubacteriales bacterium]|nr:DUF5685 family protein [Eubacteriales bacterium]